MLYCHYQTQIVGNRIDTERSLENKCLFCRQPTPNSETEFIKIVKKRIEVNDPAAIYELSTRRYEEGDFDIAIEYWTKAAGLGEAGAHYQLSVLYHLGQGVEKDEEKEFYHLEEAAIGGHVDARDHLGVIEWKNKRFERAVTHSVIAANLGHDGAIKMLKVAYAKGQIQKEDFALALRAHQAAVDETKSSQREEAEIFLAAAKQDARHTIGVRRWDGVRFILSMFVGRGVSKISKVFLFTYLCSKIEYDI